MRKLQLDRERRGVPAHHGTAEPAKNPPGQGEVNTGGVNSPDQVGIARLVPLAEEGGLQGFAEGGELGEGFGVRGGEGVGDGKIAPGEVLGAHVGDVGIDHRLHLGVRWCSGGWSWGRRWVGDCHLLPLALLGLLWRHDNVKCLEGKGNA